MSILDTTRTQLYATQADVLAQFDVNPEAPPGTEGITRVIGYVAWGAFGICLIGFIIAAATMGIKHGRGEDLPGMKGLALALLGTVLIGGAGAIVGSLAT